jgi:hypothetical protein
VVHLDAGYNYQPCRQVLTNRGMVGQIATRGVPAPVQAGRRWPVERTHAWGNQDGKQTAGTVAILDPAPWTCSTLLSPA